MTVDIEKLIAVSISVVSVAASLYSILTQEYEHRLVGNGPSRPYQTKEFKDYGGIERRDYGYQQKGDRGPIYGSAGRPVDSTTREERVLTNESVRRGRRFLLVFVILLGLLSAYTLYQFTPTISAEKLFLFIWLFVFMLLGMIVRVITANHRIGKPLFDVAIDDIVYPVLFSVIVFYPIWVMVEKEANIPFSIYSAFLNGYFWRSIVADAKPNDKNESSKKKTLLNEVYANESQKRLVCLTHRSVPIGSHERSNHTYEDRIGPPSHKRRVMR